MRAHRVASLSPSLAAFFPIRASERGERRPCGARWLCLIRRALTLAVVSGQRARPTPTPSPDPTDSILLTVICRAAAVAASQRVVRLAPARAMSALLFLRF
uniref:Secreted protein n=1 Tax=Plectus sambesii TaxID=2011161 RepID=A0A914XAG9_9BILA